MEYTGLDGARHECAGPYIFIVKVIQEPHYSTSVLKLSPEPIITPDFNPIQFAMEVVASGPPFLRIEDCPWILSYLDDLKELYNSTYSLDELGLVGRSSFGVNIFEERIREFALGNDVVSASRMMHALDVAVEILYGGTVISYDYFPEADDRSWYAMEYRLSLIDEELLDVNFYRRLVVEYDKSFKTFLTRSVFAQTQIIVTIPQGEGLKTYARGDVGVISSGAKFKCSVLRFFKTELHWANRALIEYYPTFIGENSTRLRIEPIFTVDLEVSMEIKSKLYGASVNAFIPMHWISHVYHNGEFSEVWTKPKP